MTHGPVEILVVMLPGNRFSGTMLSELATVVRNGTITIIDGLLLRREQDGELNFFEVDQIKSVDGELSLGDLVDRVEQLISEEDVNELAEALEPNSSGVILVFEHTWAAPLTAAVRASGGMLLADVHVPGPVADEVFDAIAALDGE